MYSSWLLKFNCVLKCVCVWTTIHIRIASLEKIIVKLIKTWIRESLHHENYSKWQRWLELIIGNKSKLVTHHSGICRCTAISFACNDVQWTRTSNNGTKNECLKSVIYFTNFLLEILTIDEQMMVTTWQYVFNTK